MAAKRKRHPVTNDLVSQEEYDRAMATIDATVDETEQRFHRKESQPLGSERSRVADREAMDDLAERARTGPYRYDDEPYRGEPEIKKPNMMGCLVVVMLMVMIVMGGFMIWQAVRTPNTHVPVPAPVPGPVVPVVNLDAIVAPLKANLAYDPVKAKHVYRLYSGFSQALAGPSGEQVANTRVLETVTQSYLTAAQAGSSTPVGREIDQAIATHLGIGWGSDASGETPGWEFKSFDSNDRVKLVEITAAIAKAAEESL